MTLRIVPSFGFPDSGTEKVAGCAVGAEEALVSALIVPVVELVLELVAVVLAAEAVVLLPVPLLDPTSICETFPLTDAKIP